MPYLNLTDDELLLLDGRCGEGPQAEINTIKRRRVAADGKENPALWVFISDLRVRAEQDGRLGFRHERFSGKCCVCAEGGGYYPHRRRSKWHRRGEPDLNAPILASGIDFAKSFIRVENRLGLGCCAKCWDEHRTVICDALADVRAELPQAMTGAEPRYRWHQNRQCTQCGWLGHDGEMGKSPTLMGDGYYPSTCPQCRAKNAVFGKLIVDIADGFTLVDTGAGQVPTVP